MTGEVEFHPTFATCNKIAAAANMPIPAGLKRFLPTPSCTMRNPSEDKGLCTVRLGADERDMVAMALYDAAKTLRLRATRVLLALGEDEGRSGAGHIYKARNELIAHADKMCALAERFSSVCSTDAVLTWDEKSAPRRRHEQGRPDARPITEEDVPRGIMRHAGFASSAI